MLFVEALLSLAEALGFSGAAAFVGLWWLPELALATVGGIGGSLLRATVGLIIAAAMFYKLVWLRRKYRAPFAIYFYTALSIATIFSYLYGILFRWH